MVWTRRAIDLSEGTSLCVWWYHCAGEERLCKGRREERRMKGRKVSEEEKGKR